MHKYEYCFLKSSDLGTFNTGVIDSIYFSIRWYRVGKVVIISTANEVKTAMVADVDYTLCTLPFNCPNYWTIITTGRNRFGYITISNNAVKFMPYGTNFEIGSWIYFHVPLILF